MASIREHTKKDGSKSWYVLWRDSGTGKQTSMSFPTHVAAEAYRALLAGNRHSLAAVEQALLAAQASTLTVSRLLEKHLAEPLRANQDTVAKYKSIVATHVTKQIGSIPAASLSERELADWASRRMKAGSSRKTLLNVTGLLSAAYKRGINRGWVSSNPLAAFHLPSDERPARRATFLTRAEYLSIRAALPERLHLLVDLLVETGLRFGEATALTKGNLDLRLKDPVIHVTGAWKGGSGTGWRVGPPKSRESVRDVVITADLAARLRALKADGYLFTNMRGGPLRNADFHQSSGWQHAVDEAQKAGLTKNPRPHDLRHTHASWLLAEGVPIFVVSRRLGHASIQTTTKLYGHLTDEGQRAAVIGLEAALKR